MQDFEKGQIVSSKAGRDKEHFYMVIDYVKPYLYLADGDKKRLESPKKKKNIHVQPTNYIHMEMKELLTKEAKVMNLDIRKAIDAYTER